MIEVNSTFQIETVGELPQSSAYHYDKEKAPVYTGEMLSIQPPAQIQISVTRHESVMTPSVETSSSSNSNLQMF
jgi:hypothetical protein